MKRSGLDYVQYLKMYVYEKLGRVCPKKSWGILFPYPLFQEAYSDFDLSDASKENYFILGHEHDGIPHEILKAHLDRCMRIPRAKKCAV